MIVKRSVGVTIFGILFMISAILGFIKAPKYEHLGLTWVLYKRVTGILLFFLSVKILQLKEWARKGIIFYVIVTTLLAVILAPRFIHYTPSEPDLENLRIPVMVGVSILLILWMTGVIFFFTRKKIKDQFIENRTEER